MGSLQIQNPVSGYNSRMTTTIMICFEGEPVSQIVPKRTVAFDGPVPLPEIGEHVANTSYSGPVSGTLLSRSFSYRENEVHVILTLKSNYQS